MPHGIGCTEEEKGGVLFMQIFLPFRLLHPEKHAPRHCTC
ncbi:hypothetical protein ApDm4_2443 [Acetobacter pomorum]|nr:hypothetical protein ApDm4_2443 [Acetobacter pomorum]